ncbi:MAG: MarR family winged helix-turn-helix transcriptional regulator [Pseudomonas sp.]|nr:MarR family winged helix-turn-helix transcriptional regulator [Pseudomonas sp.]
MTAITLFDLFERLSSLMRMWHRQHPLLADLQPIQVSALIYLSRCNRYSDTPLGVTEYLGLTKGTVSQSLKALEAKGLIVKTPDARDKRSVHLQLTDTARTLIDSLLPPTLLIDGEARLAERGPQLTALLAELLVEVQRCADVPSFGLCATCRFHQHVAGQPFCGLTQEPLSQSDATLICREHQAHEACVSA